MSIQPYIDLGWHTVPLAGKLERNTDGSKTIPKFEPRWRDRYQTEVNTRNSALGGVITGKVSNIIAIDCDNEVTWKLFRSLDKYNEFAFISKGKGKEAGTLIYQYHEELPQNFTIHEDGMDLDFYTNHGFVYLPTEANKSKVTLDTNPLPSIPELPETILALLVRMYKSTKQLVVDDGNTQNNNLFTASFLAPLIDQFVASRGDYMPGLFRIITPKRFRQQPQYVASAHLHPNNVPEGDGSTYLSSVSAIFAADLSVSQELYTEAMVYVNELFDYPMSQDRLDATILNPMINKKATIDGEVIWKYDDSWSQYRSIFLTKDQSTLEVVYDDNSKLHYAVDSSRSTYAVFARDTELYNHLAAVTATPKTKKEIIHGVPLVRTVTHPHKPFGFNPGNDSTKRDFNVFRATPALSVFYKPEDYAEKYKEPTTTFKFFESLIPDERMRNYLYRFLKTKLTSFKYSPVVLYFLGAPGSGKGTFVRIIEEIFGLVPAPSAQEFLDKFNGWVVGAYFVELDEYGDSLSTKREQDEAIGKLKALTGKRKVDIRKMRENSAPYEHNVTFIMTANKNPLMLDDNDRRIALFNTPNVLADQQWVKESGGIDTVFNSVVDNVIDFCYWLATNVEALPPAEYLRPPMFEGKFELIADNMPAASRIAYCFKQRQLTYLVELCLDYACDNVARELQTGTIMLSVLEDFYMELTQDKGTRRALIKALRDNGNIDVVRGGTDGTDFKLSGYLAKPTDTNPFEDQA
jgi:hypothetical protein